MSADLDTIREMLSEVGSKTAFCSHRGATAEDLHLDVEGVGKVDLPVTDRQARDLCEVARPARYGKGEETLLDREVRDTWEIPADRVEIDGPCWNRTLISILEELRSDLGLYCSLRAEFHSMLVYGPGQFFLPHQDSEKTDGMVGTLVVTLPSSFRGGSLIVEHQGERVTYAGSDRELSFVAFYADCRHEVRPVEEGHRVVLTFNLLAAADVGDADALEGRTSGKIPDQAIDVLAEVLRSYFDTPRKLRLRLPGQEPAEEVPLRLVYLLDHEYTERGLSWNRLKGADAARVAVLRSAAEAIDGEMALALAEVHETWGCMEPYWDDFEYGRRRSWRWEDDEWAEDDPVESDPDSYELTDFIDGAITLCRWLLPDGDSEEIGSYVDSHEVCWTTPSVDLQPYASEYEGYMGNYGNTMDRWYRRAAMVLWPKDRSFAVRAQASPRWALDSVRRALRSGRSSEARDMAAALSAVWPGVRIDTGDPETFAAAVEVAAALDASERAASLLRRFRLIQLTPDLAPAWVALTDAHGADWCGSLLADWAESHQDLYGREADTLEWLQTLPELCRALRGEDGDTGRGSARLLLQDRWTWLRERFETALQLPPRQRDMSLEELSGPTLGLLEGTGVVDAEAVRGEVLEYLCKDGESDLLSCAVQILRLAGPSTDVPDLDVLERHCVERLESNLALPARDADDWSIPLPPGCECELCSRLAEFLAARTQQRFEWPIAKEKRKHVHRRIDAHELPVRHETRRSGSPYTLVLTKTRELFARQERQREEWRAGLAWLTGESGQGR